MNMQQRFLIGVTVFILVQPACRFGGTPSYLSPHPSQIGCFSFFDATQVDPQAGGFQLADYDRFGHRVLFYPWGGIVTKPRGTVLAYHTDRDFFSPGSYETVDLTKLLSPDAKGFGTGFMDNDSGWAYFIPLRTDHGKGQVPNDLAVRFDLKKHLSDRTAYEMFHVGSMPNPPPKIGWITGAYANGYAYYMPFGTPLPHSPWYEPHGILLRYDASRPFSDTAAWQWFDLQKIDTRAAGFQSVAFKFPWLYMIPYYPGNNLLVRYDVTKSFDDPTSYQTVVLTNLNADAIGYTGAIVAGNDLVLVPWRKRMDLVDITHQSASVAAVFNTQLSLTDPTAWSFIDLTTLHADAKGYQFGWFDVNGLVHLVPTHNFATKSPPPFVAWDSKKPFADAQSWKVYASTGVPASTGAAYDGTFGWLAPYGSGRTTGANGVITRVKWQDCK